MPNFDEFVKGGSMNKSLDLRSPMIKKLEAERQKLSEREDYVNDNQFLLSGWRQKLLKNFNWTSDKSVTPTESSVRRYYRGEYK